MKPDPDDSNRTITIECPAKINLFLGVTGRRDDGYHELVTLMQAVSLRDRITLNFIETGGRVLVECDDARVPVDESNTVVAAVRAFEEIVQQEWGDDVGSKTNAVFSNGLSVRIDKRIPVGGGLGGGSADAAGVLRVLGERTDAGMRVLERAAAEVGSDVVFCLKGGTRWCTGRGEVAGGHVPDVGFPYYVLVCPDCSVSTPDVYTAFRFRFDSEPCPDPTRAGAAMLFSNATDPIWRNDLTNAAMAVQPVLRDVSESLSGIPGPGGMLTGSGACFFLAATCREQADDIQAEVHRRRNDCETFIVRPVAPPIFQHAPIP